MFTCPESLKIIEIKQAVRAEYETKLKVIENQTTRVNVLHPGSFIEERAIHLMTRIIEFFDAALVSIRGRIWCIAPP